jgi:hypothetical protein
MRMLSSRQNRVRPVARLGTPLTPWGMATIRLRTRAPCLGCWLSSNSATPGKGASAFSVASASPKFIRCFSGGRISICPPVGFIPRK